MVNDCINPGPIAPLAVNIGLHVVILFTIISMLFLFFISKIEKRTLNDQIQSNLNKGIDTSINNMNEYEKTAIQHSFDNPVIDSLKLQYSKPQKEATMYNKWLIRTIIMTNVVLCIIVILSIVLLSLQCNQCINLKSIVIENGITFFFVGIIEYLFFTHVALKYIPSPPSLLVNTFFESVKNNL